MQICYARKLHMINSQRLEISQKPFPANFFFFEADNIFAIRGKKPFLFHCVRENKRPNRAKLPYATKQNFRIKLFPEETFP